MRKTVLIVLLLFIFPIAANAQGKTTADPNSVQAVVKEQADQRLSQKITYSSGYKRLHEVTEDLTRISGVYIGCGQNKKDWHVRDIPLVVCVNDMPLGKLLRAIADATHTWFASEKVGDDFTKSYLIHRRYTEIQKIDDFFKTRHDALLEAIKWQWDAMRAYANSPEITDWPDWMMSTQKSDLRIVSKLISTLEPGAIDQLLTGKTFTFKVSNSAYSDMIGMLYQNACEITPYLGEGDYDQPDLSLKIKLRDTGQNGGVNLDTNLGPIIVGETSWSSSWVSVDGSLLNGKLPNLPKYPKQITTPSLQDDMNNPSMILLNQYPDDSWMHPKLKAKIDIIKPDGVKKATFADLILATSRAGGLNIVTEDFTSQEPLEQIQGFEYQNFDRLFRKQSDVADTLTHIRANKFLIGTDYTWFYSVKDNLMVGWADDGRLRRWRDQHKNLISADSLNSLKTKLDSSGVGLDDILPLYQMPQDAIQQWLINSKDFSTLVIWNNSPMWTLYSFLNDADKEKAKSEAGLPLAGLDPEWMSNCLQSIRLAGQLSTDIPQKWADGYNKAKIQESDFNKAILDPRIISTMIMRVLKSPANLRWTANGGMCRFPSALKLSKYDIEVTYTIDGEPCKYNAGGPPLAFPIYSPSREAEILKSAK